MRALTVIPRSPQSARLEDVPEPAHEYGSVLVETHVIGVCGTDVEIVQGKYGWAPPGGETLIIGHESLGRVVEAPGSSGFTAELGRRDRASPDPVPCRAALSENWDMCRNGAYTECGIKELHGFCSDRYRISPEYLVRVDAGLGELGVLLEPTSVVAKAWEQTDRIGARARWTPRRVLVTGAGPIGLLAALLGTQRGLERSCARPRHRGA